MINKSDLLLLLTEIQNNGIDCQEEIKKLIKNGISIDIISFINSKRPMDASLFYEKIRKSYNDGHSKLYINLVNEELEVSEILTTLASLQLQILLFVKQLENKPMFLRQMRFDEISKVLYNYSQTNDLIPCQKLLTLFKADLKAFEYIKTDTI